MSISLCQAGHTISILVCRLFPNYVIGFSCAQQYLCSKRGFSCSTQSSSTITSEGFFPHPHSRQERFTMVQWHSHRTKLAFLQCKTWTISSLLIRWLVLLTRLISWFSLAAHSFSTSLGSLCCANWTMPASRSILASTVPFTTRLDRNSSVSCSGRQRFPSI